MSTFYEIITIAKLGHPTRVKVSMREQGEHIHNDPIDIVLTQNEAAELRVGSTYSMQFIAKADD